MYHVVATYAQKRKTQGIKKSTAGSLHTHTHTHTQVYIYIYGRSKKKLNRLLALFLEFYYNILYTFEKESRHQLIENFGGKTIRLNRVYIIIVYTVGFLVSLSF